MYKVLSCAFFMLSFLTYRNSMKLEMLNDFMIMEKHSIDSKAVCPESGSY